MVHQHTAEHHHYESTLDALRKIIEHEGITGLYSGINGSLIGVASTNFAYFYWYSVVRSLYTKYQARHPGTAAELSLGALAGAIAQIFTIPVAVVTTRQQTQPKSERKGLFATAQEVIESEDGWSGLWRGLKASLVLCVNPAITYGTYARLKDVIFPGKARLRPWEAFGEYPHAILTVELRLTSRYSAWSDLKIYCYLLHPALDRCQSRPAVTTSARPRRQTLQDFP